MGLFIIPALYLITLATPNPPDPALEDFARFERAIGAEISVAARDGATRQGVLAAATAEHVIVTVGEAELKLRRGDVASADRLRDKPTDGAIKGAVFGLLLGVFSGQFSARDSALRWAAVTVVSAGLGGAIDAAVTNRGPIYRAPAASPQPASPSVKLSLRF